MKDVVKQHTGNLLTMNCWWFVCTCILLFISASSFSQAPDTTSISTPDTLVLANDSLLLDSLQLGTDLKSKVKYHARDSTVYDLEGERVFLYGEAQITYEEIVLDAAYIELNFSNKTVSAKGLPDSTGTLSGFPVFKQGGETFNSNTLKYNFDTKKGKILDISTKTGDNIIHGDTVKKQPDNTTFIKNGYFTTCDNVHPHYYIASRKIKVIPNNKVVTGPAEMYIADVPTPFAIPFGFFPNRQDRSSGIIVPAYGESQSLGFFLSNGGYYFGISDHFDLALTGDIYSGGSWRMNAASSYASRYKFTGNFSLSFSRTKESQKELPDYSVEKGFFVKWNHTQDSKARPNSSFSAVVNAGSNTFYKNNITTPQNYLTNTFSSSISYSKSWAGKPYVFSSSLSHSQNSNTGAISLNLPIANFSVNRLTPFKRAEQVGAEKWYEKVGIGFNSSLRNSLSTYDTILFTQSSVDRFQYGIQNNIPINTSFNVLKFFTLSPSFSYTDAWYLKTIQKTFVEESDTSYVLVDTLSGFKTARQFLFSASMNTRVYGMSQFTKGKLAAIRHVMTPSIAYSWHPDFTESQWGAYKEVQIDTLGNKQLYSIFEEGIYGGPPTGKLSALNFSLDNILEIKIRQQTDTAVVLKKVKILESLSANMGYNFAADSFNLSPLSINGRTNILEKLGVTFTATFDPYRLNESGRKINSINLDSKSHLARLTNSNLSLNYTLVGGKKEKEKNSASSSEFSSIENEPVDIFDYRIPFNLAMSYNYNYSKNSNASAVTTQTLNFIGDLLLTQNWKINFISGYDFKQKDISYTSLGIVRDLHCWEMRLNWVPFGFQANYYFQINIKSSALQDMKLSKRNDRFDN